MMQGSHSPTKLGAGQPVLVRDVCGKRATVLIRRSNTLAEAADALTLNSRTAAIVMDQPEQGATAAITENDIMQAYLINVPWTYTVEKWLLTDEARIPSFAVDHLTVRPSMQITDAAAMMRDQAEGFHACRHLIVQGDGEMYPRAVLSALDLTRAVSALPPGSSLARRFRERTVADIMKPRSALPVCNKTATLFKAVHDMLSSSQNCVLIANSDAEGPWPGLHVEEEPVGDMLGVVTPRDVLRAFVEHIPGDSRVDSWLHGLQSRMQPRTVRTTTSIADAAAVMCGGGVHHLVVVADGPEERIVGLISATDVAYELASEHQASMAVGGA